MNIRIEHDSMGEIAVAASALWGAQTERSLKYFSIGHEKIPTEIIHSLVLIKKACAEANYTLGVLEKIKYHAIIETCDLLLQGEYAEQFPLSVWQTGSGTQTNMNVNEVIAHLARKINPQYILHPNDDINKSQSTNDVFPTAMHIAIVEMIETILVPNLEYIQKALKEKSYTFEGIIKVGRTHLMDAVPISLGQEFSGYAYQIQSAIKTIQELKKELFQLAIGATAVGTGINTPKGFQEKVVEIVRRLTNKDFQKAQNSFAALACHDPIVAFSGGLKKAACALFKIANDIRWMGSGPRSGLSEIILPENEPGSSIMPGKVNPTQCEAMTMVALQVMANDTAITLADSQGNFELNVFKPLIAYNIIQSIRLLSDAAYSFSKYCIEGIVPRIDTIHQSLERSLMLATILSPKIGYEQTAKIVKKAYQENISLKEASIQLQLLSSEEFDQLLDFEKMIHPHETSTYQE